MEKQQQEVVIFLDLDGVIADFDTHKHTEGKVLPNGRVDYDNLDLDWWKTMPVYEGARDFYFKMKNLGTVKFLTGPVPIPDSFAGKAHWIMDFVPRADDSKKKWSLRDLIICPSKDKRFLAGPARILVDDREENIRDWEAAGGKGVLHTGDFKETIAQVEKVVAEINGQQNGLSSSFKARRGGPKP